jgi:hypothetical protein
MKIGGLAALAWVFAMSASELAAGGLVLTKTDAIAMQREDLTLTPDLVTVRYEMRNDTGKPVTLRVAFPMPDVPVSTPGGMTVSAPPGGYNIEMPQVLVPNFLNFFVTVDGKPRDTATEIRANLPDGRNILKDLYRLGGWRLVLQPSFYETDATMKHVDANDAGPAIHQELRKLRVIGGVDKAGMLLWATRITLHWMQTFKPGVTIVEHRYRPVLGGQQVAPEGSEPGTFDPDHGKWIGSGSTDLPRDFCISGDTDKAMRDLYRAIAKSDAHPGYLSASTLGYILKTARNWAGPIGTFHLIIKSGPIPHAGPNTAVGTIVVCSDVPLRETAPKQWEATVTNYVSTRDLRDLLLPSE